MYLADLYTVLASIAGVPAISIPNGTDENDLPIGLQVMAPAFGEAKLLAFSEYLTALT
jgi:aspartyl-tRNA(Asn)/glutamyl-tRNA(Gln) amidotransferase subunit A